VVAEHGHLTVSASLATIYYLICHQLLPTSCESLRDWVANSEAVLQAMAANDAAATTASEVAAALARECMTEKTDDIKPSRRHTRWPPHTTARQTTSSNKSIYSTEFTP